MNITGKCTVFNKEVARPDGTVWNQYTISIPKKVNDEWKSVYITANFKKGVVVADKTKINVTNGWLDLYINKENKSVLTVFISEFEELETKQQTSAGFMQVEDEGLPF